MKRGTTLSRDQRPDISNYKDLHQTDPRNCRRSVRLDIDYEASECVVSVHIGEPEYRNKGVQANVFMSTLDSLVSGQKSNKFN
jgi:hypothetical protein